MSCKKNHLFGKIIVQSAKLIRHFTQMLRISILLLSSSMLHIIVSVSLMAQYSHFPLTLLEVDGIESQKFPNFTSELETFDDIIDPSILNSGTALDFHSDLIKSPSSLEFSNVLSVEPMDVDIGIAPKGSLKEGSNFAYMQNLPDAETIISPNSPDLISDIIYFLKDLFDDDGNYSGENWLKSDYTLNGSKVPEIYYDRMSRERSIANTMISSFWGTLTVPEFQKNVESHTHHNYSTSEAKSSSNKEFFKNYRGDTTPSFQTTSTLSSNVQENREFAALDVFELENPQKLPFPVRVSKRQRRLTTYVWEMADFNDSGPGASSANDYFQLTGYGGDDLKIVLKPLSSGGVAAGTDENGSATQGVASNMPVFPESGIWTPSTRTYNDFMKITGTAPNSITIDASAVKYYMNWHYGDWDISTTDVSANHYDLVYYSAVPEPSTYVMASALVCFIGFNQKSRKSLKKIFLKISTKFNLRTYFERREKTQLHS